MIPFRSFLQEKGSISIEFNSTFNLVSIPELEKSMDKVFLELPEYITIIKRQKMDQGMGYALNANFQLSKLFSLGLYSKYLTSKSENDFRFIEDNSFIGLPADTSYGVYTQKVTNFVLGVYSDFALNNLKFWPNNNWLSRLESKVTIGIGYSYSQFLKFTYSNNYKNGVLGELNTASGIHLNGKLKFGYRLITSPIFSSIGIHVGYQYLMSNPLKEGKDSTFKENAPRLSFSGLTAGIYLTFGK